MKNTCAYKEGTEYFIASYFIICTLSKVLFILGDQIKEDGFGGARNPHDRNVYIFIVRKRK